MSEELKKESLKQHIIDRIELQKYLQTKYKDTLVKMRDHYREYVVGDMTDMTDEPFIGRQEPENAEKEMKELEKKEIEEFQTMARIDQYMNDLLLSPQDRYWQLWLATKTVEEMEEDSKKISIPEHIVYQHQVANMPRENMTEELWKELSKKHIIQRIELQKHLKTIDRDTLVKMRESLRR